MIAMKWTGLHCPDNIKPARDYVVTPAPCDQCSDKQRRACSHGLACSSYVRYQLLGGAQARDVDTEPALAEIAQLIDCEPQGASEIHAALHRARAISDEHLGAKQPAKTPCQASIRGMSAREAAIMAALPLCDGTVRELAILCRFDRRTVRDVISSLTDQGKVVQVMIKSTRPTGPKTCMAVRRMT